MYIYRYVWNVSENIIKIFFTLKILLLFNKIVLIQYIFFTNLYQSFYKLNKQDCSLKFLLSQNSFIIKLFYLKNRSTIFVISKYINWYILTRKYCSLFFFKDIKQ